MFKAVFEIAYEVAPAPNTSLLAKLPTVLEMFTIVFFVLFSTRGAKA